MAQRVDLAHVGNGSHLVLQVNPLPQELNSILPDFSTNSSPQFIPAICTVDFEDKERSVLLLAQLTPPSLMLHLTEDFHHVEPCPDAALFAALLLTPTDAIAPATNRLSCIFFS